jgi:PBP1b-binding outer membrane lipoprotein LpoB
MKKVAFIAALYLLITSCSSVRVNCDYDKKVDFSNYKSYAFLKSGIDKMAISDLDKKRIMHSIDDVMTTKGFTKSESPDLLINIFTKEREQVDVNQFNAGWGYGWGFGWNPYLWGGQTSINRYTEGTLYIDLIDAKKKELIWQGEGEGTLTKDTNKKEALIKEFVSKILEQYPPSN